MDAALKYYKEIDIISCNTCVCVFDDESLDAAVVHILQHKVL